MLGKTGLYCGEQDMFVFLIDPLGWTEIDGEAFAPGFFLWNSEVGRRSVGFVSTIRSAMRRPLGDDADAVLNKLSQRGIPRKMAKEAVELASRNGRLTIFSVVDALTRLTGIVRWIGDRTELDQKIGSLLNLAV